MYCSSVHTGRATNFIAWVLDLKYLETSGRGTNLALWYPGFSDLESIMRLSPGWACLLVLSSSLIRM